jgi:type I restriction enzyme S subunit
MENVAPLVRRPVKIDLLGEYHELGIRSFGNGTFHKPPINGAALGSKKVYYMEPGDLAFNIVFAWEGAVAVVQPRDERRIGSHRFLSCVPKDGIALSSFLCFHFLTSRGLEDLGVASPGGAGRNRTLGLEPLARIEVPVPPIEKQQWFVSLMSKTKESDHLRAGVAKELGAFMPSILSKAFRGEL